MFKQLARCWVSATLIILPLTAATAVSAQTASLEETTKIATAVPAEVPQVLTGGVWEQGKKSGILRAIVVSTGDDKNTSVDVFIQWVALEGGAKDNEIVKTVSVKEVRDGKLSNAFVFMEEAEDGHITIVITSYDPEKDEDSQIWLQASDSEPGKYKIVPAETDDTDKEEDKPQ